LNQAKPEPVQVPALNVNEIKKQDTFDFDFAGPTNKQEEASYNSDTKVSDPFATNRESELVAELSNFNAQGNQPQ